MIHQVFGEKRVNLPDLFAGAATCIKNVPQTYTLALLNIAPGNGFPIITDTKMKTTLPTISLRMKLCSSPLLRARSRPSCWASLSFHHPTHALGLPLSLSARTYKKYSYDNSWPFLSVQNLMRGVPYCSESLARTWTTPSRRTSRRCSS
jgi:hypothetical protein